MRSAASSVVTEPLSAALAPFQPIANDNAIPSAEPRPWPRRDGSLHDQMQRARLYWASGTTSRVRPRPPTVPWRGQRSPWPVPRMSASTSGSDCPMPDCPCRRTGPTWRVLLHVVLCLLRLGSEVSGERLMVASGLRRRQCRFDVVVGDGICADRRIRGSDDHCRQQCQCRDKERCAPRSAGFSRHREGTSFLHAARLPRRARRGAAGARISCMRNPWTYCSISSAMWNPSLRSLAISRFLVSPLSWVARLTSARTRFASASISAITLSMPHRFVFMLFTSWSLPVQSDGQHEAGQRSSLGSHRILSFRNADQEAFTPDAKRPSIRRNRADVTGCDGFLTLPTVDPIAAPTTEAHSMGCAPSKTPPPNKWPLPQPKRCAQ